MNIQKIVIGKTNINAKPFLQAINEAKEEGRNAFNNKRPRAPALNQAFVHWACESRHDTATLLESYVTGWDEANLNSEAVVI